MTQKKKHIGLLLLEVFTLCSNYSEKVSEKTTELKELPL
jgi:hypothetical protein